MEMKRCFEIEILKPGTLIPPQKAVCECTCTPILLPMKVLEDRPFPRSMFTFRWHCPECFASVPLGIGYVPHSVQCREDFPGCMMEETQR